MAATSSTRVHPLLRRITRLKFAAPLHDLYRRVFAVNAAILTLAVLLLTLTPFSVSSQTTRGQFAVLIAGLAVMLLTNAALLKVSLSPLERLIDLMREVDLLQPGSRLHATGSSEVAEVIAVFNGMLTRLELERRSSLRRALTAQEGERRRIALELHDQIGQDLTGVLLAIERVRDHPSRDNAEALQEIAGDIVAILEELRRISYELRPAALDDLGLASAIEALCANSARRSAFEVTLDLDAHLPELDGDQQLVVFRVAQEALTNAARHSRCTAVHVSLRRRPGKVVLEIADDGIGVADAKPRGGIRGMRERAHMLDATLRVSGGTSGGTTVALRMPVPS